jgi:hypothetical protein
MVYVWILVVAVGQISALLRKWRAQSARSWPQASASIDSTHVDGSSSFWQSNRNSNQVRGKLNYSYSVGGSQYVGKFVKPLDSEDEALEFVRDLRGLVTTVHYNPSNPRKSLLLESDVQSLLLVRSPAPQSPTPPQSNANLLPEWLGPFLWIFVFLAAVGLSLSLWVHIGALLGRRVAPEEYFWGLHVGIFVVFIPAVLSMNGITGGTRRKADWKVMLRFAPPWMFYTVYTFFAYAFLNFAFFMITSSFSHQNGGNPPFPVWRGFSGHWMLFYSASFALLYSAARSGKATGYCSHGHRFNSGYSKCPLCGSPTQYLSAES